MTEWLLKTHRLTVDDAEGLDGLSGREAAAGDRGAAAAAEDDEGEAGAAPPRLDGRAGLPVELGEPGATGEEAERA